MTQRGSDLPEETQPAGGGVWLSCRQAAMWGGIPGEGSLTTSAAVGVGIEPTQPTGGLFLMGVQAGFLPVLGWAFGRPTPPKGRGGDDVSSP